MQVSEIGLNNISVIEKTDDILGGTPVFVGTRVPVQTLFDYLGAGDSIDRFLEHFPTVQREQVVSLLNQLGKQLGENN